jgi:glycosyltransferase involved in cell wall biosynthesis
MRRVSYVVTVYNKAAYLPFLVGSLASQTGDFEREFIFVDDGSTDDSVALLHALTAALENVTIVTQANAGPAVATNVGFARAHGDFIKPMDGDDLLAPNATQALLDAMTETGAPWAYVNSLAVIDYELTATPAQALAAFPLCDIRPRIGAEPLRASVTRAQTNPSTWLATAQAVRDINGADERVFVQDYSMELRLAARFAPAILDAPLVAYPAQMGARLSGAQHQLMHDGALTLCLHLADGPPMPASLARYALHRNAERAWKWANRRAGETVGGAAFRAFLSAALRLKTPTPDAFREICAIYQAHRPIRLAPANAARGLNHA